jgi:hypothetical protein
VGPEIVVVGAVVVEVVAVVAAVVVPPDSSDGVSQAASRRAAAKKVRNLKRMGCPLEKSPDTGEEWVDLDLVITRPPLRKG